MTERDKTQRHRACAPCAAALLALGALGACTSSGAAAPQTSSTTAATPATSAAPSATTTTAAPSPTTSVDPVIAKIPAAAKAATLQGAEAFARYYVQKINEAFSAADPARFDGLYDQGCGLCSTYRNTAADFAAKGQRQQQPLLSVTSATASQFEKDRSTVNVFFDQHSVPVVDKSGRTVTNTSAGKGALTFALTFKGGHWLVESLKASAS